MVNISHIFIKIFSKQKVRKVMVVFFQISLTFNNTSEFHTCFGIQSNDML